MTEKIATYAVSAAGSKGRVFAQPPHPYRGEFARDRDRIVHSEAFRRLEGKTQVFMAGVNDNYRNRLTHSIEVAQIGRTIAAALGLNENLTEAICLAHDLGHSPFGHSGEKVLDRLLGSYGGFEHNRQTVRIVELLEHPYADFTGLNLMYETRLGLAKHSGPYDYPGESVFPEKSCTLEGQIADVADRIAYSCHDFEDAMRARLIRDGQMEGLRLYRDALDRIDADRLEDSFIRRTRTAKAIIDILVSDVIETGRAAIAASRVETVADVCSMERPLIVLSQEREKDLADFGRFLHANVYLHESLLPVVEKVESCLVGLFGELCRRPECMPGYYQRLAVDHGVPRVVCDYIAGMTDRYCQYMLEKI